MQLLARTARLAFNQSSPDSLKDILGGGVPKIPRGNAYRFQGALFIADPAVSTNFVDDVSNIASVTMVCRKDNSAGDFLFEKVIALADFDNQVLTFDAWAARTSQQFTFVLSGTETNQTMPSGKTELPIYLAFEAEPAIGDPIFLGSLTTTIFEEGIGTAGTPTPGDPTYFTAAQSDARYAPLSDTPLLLVADAASVDGPGKYFIGATAITMWSPTAGVGGTGAAVELAFSVPA